MNSTPAPCALVSVSDKEGIVDFCRRLSELGIDLLSTGGTAKLLQSEGIAVTEVSDYTGFPEIMDGRVKTLHPKIHGGILGRRGIDDGVMAEHAIRAVDFVIVNLYPFEQTIRRENCDLPTAIENIDIGGPAMIRAAAKNYQHVAVIVDPSDYAPVLQELEEHPLKLSATTKFELAVKSFAHTARYDGMIAGYLSRSQSERFGEHLQLNFRRQQTLRYGENPHQQAAFYAENNAASGTIAAAKQWQGKELSYNNIADADAALECVKEFSGSPACVIVKHANPCGAAVAEDLLGAYELAYATDPTSAFGGIIAFNQSLDLATAEAIIARQFVEVIIAPTVDEDALAALAGKQNVRVLSCGDWGDINTNTLDYKRVAGGLLVQDRDVRTLVNDDIKIVSRRPPSAAELTDLMFAWKVVKHVKSNAIVYSKNSRTVGIGAGQMSRVYSAKLAALKAADEKLEVAGSVMASDAFLPFRDGIDAAAEAGIRAVIQPGGSVRDAEVIAAADQHDMAMVFTGIRHFRH